MQKYVTYFKKENNLNCIFSYIRAEEDCTTSLTLDDTYVKAYQRRAAARRAINKLEEAQEDLVVVLKLEPKNSESFKEMISLRQQIQEVIILFTCIINITIETKRSDGVNTEFRTTRKFCSF